MPSWKDKISLICFIIDRMGQNENGPAKFLIKYHINT